MVDFLCSQYGWTPDQVFALTRPTIEGLLEEARERLHAQYRFYASLVGAELRDDHVRPDSDDPRTLLKKVQDIGVDFEVVSG